MYLLCAMAKRLSALPRSQPYETLKRRGRGNKQQAATSDEQPLSCRNYRFAKMNLPQYEREHPSFRSQWTSLLRVLGSNALKVQHWNRHLHASVAFCSGV